MTDANTAQLAADLKATDDAVRANGWVAPGLGMPDASMGLLGSTLDPLSGLTTAGLGWFVPFVSFLGEGLTQLRGGDAAAVTSGARDFGAAGTDIADVAGSYRDSTSAQTSGWSGEAAAEYRDAGARHADGIAGLGQASTTVGSAIIGAGQVVAQAIAEVTELITEAVAQIVPIMTQAMARAAETFGQSVVEAIPPCVGIAVEYAMRIAAKLAALLASGDNLLKLVQGGMGAVDLIQQALSGISQQSIGAGLGAGVDRLQGGGPASALSGNTVGAGDPAATGSAAPLSSSGGPSTSGGSVAPQGTHSWTPPATYSTGTVPEPTRSPGQVSGSGVATSVAPGNAVLGSGGSGGRGGPLGATPLGAVGGGQAAGETDKEHTRKYQLADVPDEVVDAAPPVITSDG
jgi:hypothetical protein